MKIKLTQPASVNGGSFNFKPGQTVAEGEVPRWVIDLLLGSGYAEEVRERKKKDKSTGGLDG